MSESRQVQRSPMAQNRPTVLSRNRAVGWMRGSPLRVGIVLKQPGLPR